MGHNQSRRLLRFDHENNEKMPKTKKDTIKNIYFFDKNKYQKDTMTEIVAEIYSWYPQDYTYKDLLNRPLFYIFAEKMQIPKRGMQDWIYRIKEYINKAKNLKVLGGGFKDVVITDDGYVYTFYIPDKKSASNYITTLQNLTWKIQELDPQIQDRINSPKTEDDICVHGFTVDEGLQQTLVMTRLKYCPKGDLNEYKLDTDSVALRVQKFAQMSYELVKTLRALHSVGIYLLDIKPRNIFACFTNTKNEAREVFAYGDVDMAMNCESIEMCRGKTFYTRAYTTKILMDFITNFDFDLEWKSLAFAMRDIYALMKSLLVTFIKLNKPDQKHKDIMKGALKNLMPKHGNKNRILITMEDIDTTVESLKVLIENIRYSMPTKNNVRELLIGEKGILQLMKKAGHMNRSFLMKPKIQDKMLKSIQKLAKKCGARSFKLKSKSYK